MTSVPLLTLRDEVVLNGRTAMMIKDTDEERWDFMCRRDLARMDKWQDMLNANFTAYLSIFPSKVRRRVRRGIPNALRGLVWQKLAGSQELALKGKEAYLGYLAQDSPWEQKIVRDLHRTLPKHTFYRDRFDLGQTSLGNVLKAYSVYDPQVRVTRVRYKQEQTTLIFLLFPLSHQSVYLFGLFVRVLFCSFDLPSSPPSFTLSFFFML